MEKRIEKMGSAMNMSKKALWLFAFLALFAVYAHAQQFDSEADFRWEMAPDSDSVVITGYTGAATYLRIPPTIQGLPVTEIAPWALLGHTITGLTIPDTVITIAAMAFASNQIAELSLGSNVTYIGLMAFANNRLTSVTIPYGVSTIGYAAFRDNLLTHVTIPASVTSIGDGAFGDAALVMEGGGAVNPLIFVVPPPPPGDPTRFRGVGFSGGLSIIEPVIDSGALVAGGAVFATISPWSNIFIKIGGDIARASHSDFGDFSSWSFYPFAHLAFFAPVFDSRGGLYAGTGAGFMMTSYNDHSGSGSDFFFALDIFTAGLMFTFSGSSGWGLNASYTMRTDFSGLSDRISIGLVYRFL